jgi:hypothetical protein
MIKSIFFLSFIFISQVQAICIHEKTLSGYELQVLRSDHQVYISTDDGRYQKLGNNKINGIEIYQAQLIKKSDISEAEFESYNKRYIEYYRYQNIIDYLGTISGDLSNLGYSTTIVGKSIKGRNLFAVKPIHFDPNKKTIVMFGRHHGDEGTANWIIEGFVDDFLKIGEDFHKNFQLVLYPMINPDGAEAKVRYNDNGRDLNRSWDFKLSKNYDEARIIHKDLKGYLSLSKTTPIVLDMHGSFTDDFIYRVKKNYIDQSFFNLQQDFIDELAKYDFWQNGIFKLSNGHKKMARLVLVTSYGLNSLTHETPRDIKLNSGRSKIDLFEQGRYIFSSIDNIY